MPCNSMVVFGRRQASLIRQASYLLLIENITIHEHVTFLHLHHLVDVGFGFRLLALKAGSEARTSSI